MDATGWEAVVSAVFWVHWSPTVYSNRMWCIDHMRSHIQDLDLWGVYVVYWALEGHYTRARKSDPAPFRYSVQSIVYGNFFWRDLSCSRDCVLNYVVCENYVVCDLLVWVIWFTIGWNLRSTSPYKFPWDQSLPKWTKPFSTGSLNWRIAHKTSSLWGWLSLSKTTYWGCARCSGLSSGHGWERYITVTQRTEGQMKQLGYYFQITRAWNIKRWGASVPKQGNATSQVPSFCLESFRFCSQQCPITKGSEHLLDRNERANATGWVLFPICKSLKQSAFRGISL